MKKIITVIAVLFAAYLVIRVADLRLSSSNSSYMYWRFYNGSRGTQSALLSKVMTASNDKELDRLNRYLIEESGAAVFSKAAWLATEHAVSGDLRYMPFISNVIMRVDIEYARRSIMLSTIEAFQLPDRYIWYEQIAANTNDMLSISAGNLVR